MRNCVIIWYYKNNNRQSKLNWFPSFKKAASARNFAKRNEETENDLEILQQFNQQDY
jgi:hypothetical protein